MHGAFVAARRKPDANGFLIGKRGKRPRLIASADEQRRQRMAGLIVNYNQRGVRIFKSNDAGHGKADEQRER